MNDISRHISEMKRTAEFLMAYSYPAVGFDDELALLPLKQRVLTIDGYDLAVFSSKSDFKVYQSESIQIQSLYSPFLPFNLVCKVGQMFLGNKNLTYLEFFQNQRKLYCWTIRIINGETLPMSEAEPAIYEGFEYSLLHDV